MRNRMTAKVLLVAAISAAAIAAGVPGVYATTSTFVNETGVSPISGTVADNWLGGVAPTFAAGDTINLTENVLKDSTVAKLISLPNNTILGGTINFSNQTWFNAFTSATFGGTTILDARCGRGRWLDDRHQRPVHQPHYAGPQHQPVQLVDHLQ